MVAKKKTTKKSRKGSDSKEVSMEKEILNILDKQRDKTLLIYQIEEETEYSTEDVTKAIRRLEENRKVKSKLVMDDSRWILQVKKIHDYQTKNKKLKWKTMNDLPCFICPYSKKCDEGQKQYNPRRCAYLTDWLLTSIKDEKFTGNPFHPEYDNSKK